LLRTDQNAALMELQWRQAKVVVLLLLVLLPPALALLLQPRSATAGGGKLLAARASSGAGSVESPVAALSAAVGQMGKRGARGGCCV